MTYFSEKDQDRRFFKKSERDALFVAAGGVCVDCGIDLAGFFHGDHEIAYANGGVTDVTNGEARCAKCNLSKGVKNYGINLRNWQIEASERFRLSDNPNFLCVATPGAGKTTLALYCAKQAIDRGHADRIVIVCPSVHLKSQWARSAHSLGIDIDPVGLDGRERRDYQGSVITYQQAHNESVLQRHHCGKSRTFVIFDEIHHAGEQKAWGNSLNHAFEPAIRRLLLSGTPFRSDNKPIPFVSYQDNRSMPDYTYGYSKALNDDVCRPIFFPKYEGELTYFDSEGIVETTFATSQNEEEARKALRAAVDGKWLNQVVYDANLRLNEIRLNHPDAAGLVIARDQNRARNIGEFIEGMTGQPAIIVVSDDDEARCKLEFFSDPKCNSSWIVAVNMVSEGVDIPRLRVGVYASTILTEMYFRQVVGRFVRMLPDLEEQSAYLFIPSHSTLKAYAKEIKEERDHQLDEEVKRILRDRNFEGNGNGNDQQTLFIPGDGRAMADGVVADGDEYSEVDLIEATGYMRKFGIKSLCVEDAAKFLRGLKEEFLGQQKPKEPSIEPLQTKPRHKRVQEQRALFNKLARRFAMSNNIEYSDVFRAINVNLGIKTIKAASEDQVLEAIQVINRWIKNEENHPWMR